MFTPEQPDAIIADRLQHERNKYADYDDLKRAKGELDQLKAAQLSEAEKLQKRAEANGAHPPGWPASCRAKKRACAAVNGQAQAVAMVSLAP